MAATIIDILPKSAPNYLERQSVEFAQEIPDKEFRKADELVEVLFNG